MKKLFVLFLVLILTFSLACCKKTENKADTSLKEGEISISGTVEQVNGNILLISDGKGGRYSFCFSDDTEVVVDGYYAIDMSADSFKRKKVTVICSAEIMETYPAQLRNERMIIVER